MGAYKTKEVKCSFSECVEAGKQDALDIKDELQEWHDNMTGTALENTSKYGELEEAIDQLEDLEQLDDPSDLVVEAADSDVLTVILAVPKRKGYNPSRASRLGNAESYFSSAIERISYIVDKLSGEIEGEEDEAVKETLQAQLDACEEYLSSLEEAVGYLEVEIPGMY